MRVIYGQSAVKFRRRGGGTSSCLVGIEACAGHDLLALFAELLDAESDDVAGFQELRLHAEDTEPVRWSVVPRFCIGACAATPFVNSGTWNVRA